MTNSTRLVHYRGRAGYACGVGRRWSSQQITSSASHRVVTCRGCRRTHAYRAVAA